jgi:multidrug efflux pump subunit AcrB
VELAFGESTILRSPRPIPPPGVVFVTHLARPDEYEKLVVKATADGKVVRLKDVAVVERVGSE